MSRPPKCRTVEFVPQLTYFKPTGVPVKELTEVVLSIEELEAIRLKDIICLEQEACAERMGISRPTYCRILCSARQKIAEALICGKAIRVEGGHFRMALIRYQCQECGHQWEQECRPLPECTQKACPACKQGDIIRINEDGSPYNCHHWKDGKEM